MKKSNNKGFSLVELIVVVAIMAVLVGVLASAYLRYVEKTRLQKDNSAIGEVCAALQAGMADEECYNEASVAAGAKVVSLTKDGLTYHGALPNLEAEAQEVVGEYALTSKQYSTSTIEIVVNAGTIYVKGFVDDAGDVATVGFVTGEGATCDGEYPNGLTTTKASE